MPRRPQFLPDCDFNTHYIYIIFCDFYFFRDYDFFIAIINLFYVVTTDILNAFFNREQGLLHFCSHVRPERNALQRSKYLFGMYFIAKKQIQLFSFSY